MKKLAVIFIFLMIFGQQIHASTNGINIPYPVNLENDRFTQISSNHFEIAHQELEKELAKYNTQFLKNMNITLNIVSPGTRSGGFSEQYLDKCNIFIAYDTTAVKDDFNRIIHHEIFHCYDRYTWKYDISPHVKIMYPTLSIKDSVAEDRAEYFAAVMLNDFKYFDGSKRETDNQMNAKIEAIMPEVRLFIAKPKVERTFRNGKISEITYTDVVSTTKMIFDYENNRYWDGKNYNPIS